MSKAKMRFDIGTQQPSSTGHNSFQVHCTKLLLYAQCLQILLKEYIPFSLHFTETNKDFGFFLWKQLFLHLSLQSSQEEGSQNLLSKIWNMQDHVISVDIFCFQKKWIFLKKGFHRDLCLQTSILKDSIIKIQLKGRTQENQTLKQMIDR